MYVLPGCFAHGTGKVCRERVHICAIIHRVKVVVWQFGTFVSEVACAAELVALFVGICCFFCKSTPPILIFAVVAGERLGNVLRAIDRDLRSRC